MIFNLIGKRFGKLLVLGRNPEKRKSHAVYWDCLCDCGTTCTSDSSSLRNGAKIKSCGCVRRTTGKDHFCWKGTGKIGGHFFSRIKNNAIAKKRVFDITIEDAWQLFLAQHQTCALTGMPLAFNSKTTLHDGNASLDRIDSAKGYSKGNIQWVHKDINRMKSDFPEGTFVEMCHRVAAYTPLTK